MLAASILEGRISRQEIGEQLFRGLVADWLFQNCHGDLYEQVRDLEELTSQPELAVSRLIYVLDPKAPINIGGRWFPATHHLAEYLLDGQDVDDPTFLEGFHNALHGNLVSEWLQARLTIEGESESLNQMSSAVSTSQTLRSEELGTQFFFWRLLPEKYPIIVNGHPVINVEELIRLVDASGDSWTNACKLLHSGELITWLRALHDLDSASAQRLESFAENQSTNINIRLDGVLNIVHPSISQPQVELSCNNIDFGTIPRNRLDNQSADNLDAVVSQEIRVRNFGRGYLNGIATLEGDSNGFCIESETIEGNVSIVRVGARPGLLPAGSRQNAQLVIRTNGGVLRIPLVYQISTGMGRKITESLGMGLAAGCLMAMLRLVLGSMTKNEGHIQFTGGTQFESVLHFSSTEAVATYICIGLIVSGALVYAYMEIFLNKKALNDD